MRSMRTRAAAGVASIAGALLMTGCTFLGLAQSGANLPPPPPRSQQDGGGQGVVRHNIEQATSDRAQLTTIAFDALAWMTGDFCRDTFLPPGKVTDYFGFQFFMAHSLIVSRELLTRS